jgi:hypothetical protein
MTVIGQHWHTRQSELSFVIRSLAGAASRHGPVSVLVPGPGGRIEPDGAFDPEGLGSTGEPQWPAHLDPAGTVVVDELTPDVTTLLTAVSAPAVFFLASGGDKARPSSWRTLRLVETEPGDPSPWVTVHVPVNPLAKLHRHHGFGFTGYLLVLSDRSHAPDDPPSAVGWLSAALPDADILLVDDAVASAWKGRALRGRVHIDTRMDLWRLMAHASACIDLAPGRHIARECVEALRFGTPIIVPADAGPAATHARAGGGWTFGDPADLIAAVTALRDGDSRAVASEAGRRYADARYGDADAVVERVGTLLDPG